MTFARTGQVVMVLVVLISVMKTSSALQCYVCTSPPNGPCGEHFNPSGSGVLEMNCQYGLKFCAKSILKNAAGEKWSRACFDKEASNRCETGAGGTACAYTCTSDQCNSGSIVSTNVLYSLMLGVAAFAFVWMGRSISAI